jgi:hypothetical protein
MPAPPFAVDVLLDGGGFVSVLLELERDAGFVDVVAFLVIVDVVVVVEVDVLAGVELLVEELLELWQSLAASTLTVAAA